MTKEEKKKYDHQYRKRKKHRVIIFTLSQYNFLLRKAKEEGKPFGTYVRELALSQAKNEYVIPYNQQGEEVKILLVRIGTNINQIARVINTKQEVFADQIEEVQNQFSELRDGIHKIYNAPLQVKDLVRRTVFQNPAYAKEIKTVLKETER